MHRTRRLVGVGFLWLACSAPAETSAERLPIKAYATADGLAHNGVNRIVRDSRGFLWFATNDGLSRFDGYAFSNYSVEHGLPHRRVTDLLETRSGELWVATFGGLVRFRPEGTAAARVAHANDSGAGTPMFTTVVPAGGDSRARALQVLLEGRDGTIWCGTRDGLFRLDRVGGRLDLRPVDLGLASEFPERRYVNDLVEDEHGSLWAATPSGLYRRWRDGAAARYAAPAVLAYDHLHDLMKDRDGRIWVGSRYDGFFRLAAGGGRAPPVIVEHHAYPARSMSWVYQLLQGSDGRFWVASNHGLVEFLPHPGADGSRFRVFNRSHGLSHQEVTALAEDAGGNLWAGTWASGAMKIARHGFVTYGRQDGVGAAPGVFDDAAGELWIKASVIVPGPPPGARGSAGDEHLITRFGRFTGRGFDWLVPGAPFEWGYVGEGNVLRTRAGEWWLGTGRGLFRYSRMPRFAEIRGRTPARIFTTHEGRFLQVYRLFEDSRGDVWVAVFSEANGLYRWSRETDTLRDMATVEGFPPVRDELPRALGEDRAGHVWVGLDSGVARYRNGRFTFFREAAGLPAGSIVGIHADTAGRLWLASARGGLIRVDQPAAEQPAFRAYTTADGLSGNSIEVLTEDRYGRIYAATGRGVDQLDPATSQVRQFTGEDGVTPGRMFAAFREPTGALWFGSENGLSRFEPTAPEPSEAPPIVVTGLTVAGRPRQVSAIGETALTLEDLRPGGNQVQIDFASLRFAPGERLRYQYRLAGADEEWGAASDRRSVSYAGLSPGRYRFEVRAVNAAGTPSPTPAVVAFTVLPPLWARWWFLSLAALATAAAALALHRYRLGRALEVARVRTRIATDLHDDIGANLTRIAILSEVTRQRAAGGHGSVDASLSSIAQLARESVAAMSDIVWAINPERDTLDDVARKIRSEAEEVFETRDIALALDLPGLPQPVKVGVDVRRDLYLVFKEAATNAARHAGCSRVSISLRVADTRLILEVRDDGIGFDPEGEREGNGLASMRRRAARLGGVLEVESRAGAGTMVRLAVPLGEGRPPEPPTPTGR